MFPILRLYYIKELKMTWIGEDKRRGHADRRSGNDGRITDTAEICKYCPDHTVTVSKLDVVIAATQEINKKLDGARSIWVALIILALGMIGQFVYLAVNFGEFKGTVNTRLAQLEQQGDRRETRLSRLELNIGDYLERNK
jgi:hypothetical protein